MNTLKTKLQTLKKAFFLYIITWTAGLLVGSLFWILHKIKQIQVVGLEHLPTNGQNIGTIIVSNHPSYLDPFILPMLYWPKLLWNPARYFPYGTPDWENFYNHWYFSWVKYAHTIPIYRTFGTEQKNISSVATMIRILNTGATMIFFPEGGRTFKREQKINASDGKKTITLGKLIDMPAKLSNKLGEQCRIVPVWVEGSDLVLPHLKWLPRPWRAKITITIGQPITKTITTRELEHQLINLGLTN